MKMNLLCLDMLKIKFIQILMKFDEKLKLKPIDLVEKRFYLFIEYVCFFYLPISSIQNISKEPIILKIYSPKVVTLTLIDLPGLTKV